MKRSNNEFFINFEGTLCTKWTREVTSENVHNEYPRPQMVRKNWLNLNGLWDYAIRQKEESKISSYDGKILVPFPVESTLSGVKKPLTPEQKLWYRRYFEIPDSWREKRLLLHFGAVDWKAEIWINGCFAGMHTGGFYPFTFEISEFINGKENEIVVAVWDPTDTYGQERGKQVLNPSGLFYTAISGIWQTVWIEPVPNAYIKTFKITPDIDKKKVVIFAEADGMNENMETEASVFEEGVPVNSGKCRYGGSLEIPLWNMKLWSPDNPFLYNLTLRLISNGEVIDEVESYFGMRKFSIGRDEKGVKRLFLNNKPVFFNGVLDQGYWPDGLYTAPTDEALESDVKMIKNMGFNMVRKHIKVEPARWYYHCDRHGLVVWQDMINGGSKWNVFYQVVLPYFSGVMKIKDNKYRVLGRDNKSNRDNFRKELKEMVDSLYNVPSIGMWVVFNEAWGQFDAEEIYNWLKGYDQTRITDHASGWYDQEIGELKSVHIYFRKLSMPKRIKDRVVVISEYGGYSLPVQGHLWQPGKGFGYKTFNTANELQKAYESLIREQVRPLVDKGVSAVVYTQLTDVETEINGLMTYDREVVKMDISFLNSLNKELSDCLP